MSTLAILSLLGRGLSARYSSLTRPVKDAGGVLLPSDISGGALLCFQLQSHAAASLAGSTELSPGVDLLLAFVLVTCLLRDTTWTTILGILTGRLIAPFWHRLRERFPTPGVSSAGRSRSLRQWLCCPSRNEKNTRPCRSTRVSQNRAPPYHPSLSTCSHT